MVARRRYLTCVMLMVMLAGEANGDLVVREFASGQKVVEDTAAGNYWIWDLNMFTSKNYGDQILDIALLGTYGNIHGGWHMASASELAGLWSYSLWELAAAFNPVPPGKTGGPDYIGRYDYVDPDWTGPPAHGVAYVLLGADPPIKSVVPSSLRQQDASAHGSIGAWVTAPGPADSDDDGVTDDEDNCPQKWNPGQEDADGDGKGDVCDRCPHDPDNDVDGDGVCGDVDNCPYTSNKKQKDDDGDGVGDACDECADTPEGALVDGSGCAICQYCPCSGDWNNHGQFVRCVAHIAELWLEGDLITDAEKGAIVSEAAQSDCGKKEK